ncbi:MAG TPA: HAD-IA family hydrolase [Polyangiaceae bacterium]|nr:HAD-IA family hydrolase [Polyangiaceae bacterium]
MPADMAEHVRGHFGWLSEFSCVTISHEVRRIKPEPEIFLHCLNELGVSPDKTLFIDDRETNVDAARKLGIVAIRFESPVQLSSELARLGFPVLPSAIAHPSIRSGFEQPGVT